MKTIFDAVNELHGEVLYSDVRHIVTRPSTGQIILRSRSDLDVLNTPTWSHLCSIEEFNALVEEMKLGLDVNEITERMFHCYMYGAKELLKPVNTLTIGGNYEFSDDNANWEGGELVCISHSVPLAYQSKSGNKREWYSSIREVKQASSTCTQKMTDSGALPSVGFKLKYQHEFIEGSDFQYLSNENQGGWEDGDSLEVISLRVDSNGCNVAIVLNTEEDVLTCASVTADFFKEITPPVPLIDGKAYQFECDGFSDLNGIYSELDHSFYNHLGDSEVAECTNIQPLTLKGE